MNMRKLVVGAVIAAGAFAPMNADADFTVGFADVCAASGGPSVPSAYIDAFSAQGATTRVLAWTEDAAAITNMVNGVDLLVLCGGEDVDPARYGATRKSYCRASNLTRDAFEWELLGAAVALGKPVFGICRGNQMINVFFGGTLYQDLAQEHGAAHPSTHVVQVMNDGYLKPIFQSSYQSVNSTHHQAVKDLAPGFTVAATASDGVIEAIENKALNVRGVQFHPEALQGSDPKFAAIFRWLVTGALPDPIPPTGAGTLVAKWDFQNYDPANPKSAAVLASALPGGVAGEPRYYSGAGTAATPDGTLYNMYVVDSTCTECPGLNPGEYALAIPKYSHVKLTVPDSVKNHAWSMRLKYYRPADATAAKACFFSKNLNNTTDGALFIQGTDYPALGCSTGIFNPKGGRSALGYRWHEIVINADASGNTVYLDGDVAVTSIKDSSTFFNDGGILLAGDNSGEDNLLFISEVSIYDGFTTPTKNLSATTTLDADADWRADGEVRIPAGGVLDLAGHSLAVSSLKPGALEPVAKWNFNNYDSSNPKSAAVLASALPGGDAAIPCSTNTNGKGSVQLSNIGNMSLKATGRLPGEYMLRIPVGNHLRLPVPDSVKNHAWAMVIKMKYITSTNYKGNSGDHRAAILQRDLTNNGDASLFISKSAYIGANSNTYFKPYGSLVVVNTDLFQEMLIVANANGNKVYMNGELAHESSVNTTDFFNNGAILFCADDDKEDQELEIVEVSIYDTDQVAPTHSQGTALDTVGIATITDTVGGGELHIDLDAETAIRNHGIRFAGGVKVVKDGDGIWADCAPHSHTGGTEIAGGTYRIERSVTPFGANGSAVKVCSGATLDVCGQHPLNAYSFEFAGGTLVNGYAVGDGYAQMSNVRLTADSTFVLHGSYGLVGSSWGATSLDLGGYNLDSHAAYGARLFLVNTSVGRGNVTMYVGGVLQFGKDGQAGSVDASEASFVNYNHGISVFTPTTVGSWISLNTNGTYNAGTETITVVDRLCVNDSTNGLSKIHTALLANGATLDLSALDTAWIPKSVFGSNNINYVTFAENAGISVDLGERPVRSIATSSDPYIVKWNDAPQPSATTKFSLTSAEGNATSYRLRADATGLKVFFTPGLVLTIK